MTNEQRAQILTIARRALGIVDSEARTAFLDQSCRDDLSLRREVVTFIAMQESATLDEPVEADPEPRVSTGFGEMSGQAADLGSLCPSRSTDTPADVPTTLAGSTLFGRYQLLYPIGEGGMGVVHLARQSNPDRSVALKVIRPGFLTPQRLRRFDYESRVLGRLQHPGIAQIYEAGTVETAAGTQPFFAMEYVEGAPLDAHVRDAALKRPEILDLLATICDAVHHAHVKGVIHRDLKPANILVDAGGQPKVLDFGVARTTDDDDDGNAGMTMATSAGQLLGTIQYMSPEQISGDPTRLDTRSDVYSLGVILYELLIGRRPHDFENATITDAARLITEVEPTRPSSFDRSLGGDVETILRTALEKDPERRYQSAADLAADIRRHLRDEPINAHPPSTVYVLRKFARRNKALVTGSAIAVIALVLGVLGTTWQAIAARQAERAAATEATNAKVVNAFLLDMLVNADPEMSLGRDLTIGEVLDSAAATIDAGYEGDPLAASSLHQALGQTYRALGDLDRAEHHFVAARGINDEFAGPTHRWTTMTMLNLGATWTDAGRFDDAESLVEETRVLLERTHGRDDPEAIQARADLARIAIERGDLEQAEAMLSAAIADAERTGGLDEKAWLTLRHNYATCLSNLGHYERAETQMRLALAERTEAYGPEHPQTLYTFNNLGTLLQEMGRLDEAEALFRATRETRQRVLGPRHPGTLTTSMNLANVLTQLERREEAVPLTRQNLAACTERLGETHPRTLVAMNTLAYLLEDLGQDDESEPIYRRIIAAHDAAGAGDINSLGPRNNLAMLLRRTRRFDEADTAFRELLAAAATALPDGHPYGAIFENNYGACLLDMERYDDARSVLEDTHARLTAAFGEGHPRTVKAVERLVRLYEITGQSSDADAARALLPASG